MTQTEVIDRLKLECVAAGSQRAFALRHDISPSYVGDVLDGTREPGAKILAVLGLRKVVRYERQRPYSELRSSCGVPGS